jgi:hypothetical protein
MMTSLGWASLGVLELTALLRQLATDTGLVTREHERVAGKL